MKQLILLILLFLVCGLITSNAQTPTPSPSPTPSVEIDISDIQQIRKIIADRDYWKARATEEEEQKDKWKTSSAKWQNLYESEKFRADGVQENRIAELTEANKALKASVFELRVQADSDRQRLGEQQFTINKLKSARKWYFATGLGVGFGAGFFTGYQTGVRFRF